ncbi:MAG TPA: class I SAM-dependent methyltransferase [Chlamydiales bacterium]|nr:class I SAM-dependent methyltransferase [Chlamydiales bacterium]
MDDQAPPPSHYEEIIVRSAPHETPSQMKEHVYELMSQLHGWCSNEKAGFLIDLVLKVKPKVIVEIGVWGGKSLIPMAYALRENNEGIIYGIDPWESKESTEWVMEEVNRAFWEGANHHWVLEHLLGKIDQYGLVNQVRLFKSTSEAAPPIPEIDILHIDGNHSEHTSYIDVTKWTPFVKPGGWIIFDDMKWFEKGVFTTSKATHWLDEHCNKFAEITDANCSWGIWTKL